MTGRLVGESAHNTEREIAASTSRGQVEPTDVADPNVQIRTNGVDEGNEVGQIVNADRMISAPLEGRHELRRSTARVEHRKRSRSVRCDQFNELPHR